MPTYSPPPGVDQPPSLAALGSAADTMTAPASSRSTLLRQVDPTAHIAVIATDPALPDNPIIDCNEHFLELTGYPREEVIGRNCRFLAGPGTDPKKSELLRKAVRQRRPAVVELVNYRRDGSPFLNSVMIAPVFEHDGSLAGFLGSQVEVAEANLGNRARAARTAVTALSQRQSQVLSRLAAGRRTKQIAHELGLSERTVKMHRTTALRALGLKSSAEAIRLAVEAGL